jgi:class 3 adenylate cyclase
MPLPPLRYRTPTAQPGRTPRVLVAGPGTPDELRLPFYDEIEIGRDDGRPAGAGLALVADPTISRRHCVVAHRADGRCYVRDISRNGTRLDGRRLVPNIEMELRPGQRLSLSAELDLVLEGEEVEAQADREEESGSNATVAMPASAFATLLVGDIRDYTVLVRRAPSSVLQHSVNRVFEVLSRAVGRLGGTVKEYQGDALVAFWEGRAHGSQIGTACHAAIELDRLARQLATDASVWQIEDFPLQMDWALATGPVMIDSIGGSSPTGLSMIGEPIVLAFRLEKFANDELGRILTCRVTRQMAGPQFQFRDLGEMKAKGFDKPDRVFALEGERLDSSEPAAEADVP